MKLLRRILRTTQYTSANKTFLAPNSRTVRNPPLLKWRLGMYRILGVVYPRGGSPLLPDLFGFNFTINIVVEKKNHTSEIVYEIEVRHKEREKKKKRKVKKIFILWAAL